MEDNRCLAINSSGKPCRCYKYKQTKHQVCFNHFKKYFAWSKGLAQVLVKKKKTFDGNIWELISDFIFPTLLKPCPHIRVIFNPKKKPFNRIKLYSCRRINCNNSHCGRLPVYWRKHRDEYIIQSFRTFISGKTEILINQEVDYKELYDFYLQHTDFIKKNIDYMA